jgi:ABC-type polysaccharide/polyol phosphate export permease
VTSLAELVANRQVLWALVWRDLKARYRGSVLGFLWTFLNPLLLMAIYSLVFSVYMRVDLPHYPIFVFAGLLPWMWFSTAVATGAGAIVEGASLIKRVAFPPHVLPAVTVVATLVNFLLGLPLLLAFMVGFGVPVRAAALTLPAIIAIQLVFTASVATAMSLLTVRYRDLQHLLASAMTLWFFVTPVLYPTSLVPPSLQPLLVLNPMTPIVLAYQDAIYHGRVPALEHLALAAAFALAALAAALTLCNRWRWTLVEEV